MRIVPDNPHLDVELAVGGDPGHSSPVRGMRMRRRMGWASVALMMALGCDSGDGSPADAGSHGRVCVHAVDCDPGTVCVAGSCADAIRCTSSRMCPGLVCDLGRALCVECTSDVDCTAGLTCQSDVCAPPAAACHSDRDCSAMGLVCDVAGGVCVECVRPVDCGLGMYCAVDHVCRVGETPDAGPESDAGGPPPPVDAGAGHDAGGTVGADAGTPAGHGAIHVRWTISDTYGPLTCYDVGMASVL